jgi:hypothetical protein
MNTDQALYLLRRGTKLAHATTPFPTRAGNFTLVQDAPELRFHDGVTPGGIVIPLDESTWKIIKQLNTIQLSDFGQKKKGFWKTLLEYIRN